MPPQHIYQLLDFVQAGGSALVFKAVEKVSGKIVAVKKSRVSQLVKRPLLRYESIVLRLLQGHPAIPVLFGYAQLPHFEYIAMELLGPSIREHVTGPVATITASCVVYQMLSALEHVHRHGFVHRDIKPENILLSLSDPSKICLVDFGITRMIKAGKPSKYDPSAESREIVGTLNWASLNSHNGIELAPRDDLESLAYTAFYLLRGDLPWRWRRGLPNHGYLSSMRRIHAIKMAISGEILGAEFPAEFSYLLDYSRRMEYGQMPDYQKLQCWFAPVGNVGVEERLDWNPVSVDISATADKVSELAIARIEAEVEGKDQVRDANNMQNSTTIATTDFSDSYFDFDFALHNNRNGERDDSLTLPGERVGLVVNEIPEIGIAVD